MLKINAKTKQETLFTWEGSRLLQELRQDKVYTYVYTEQNSYEPLAQIQSFRQPEKHKTDVKPTIYYYHTDQIGIPREMTDEEGNMVWRGQYSGWGKLLHEEKANNYIHQPFRLQNQYADEETGLHYNFFRYYDAHCGRFTQQDPIGLLGGENLYAFAINIQQRVDPLGLSSSDVEKIKVVFNHNVTDMTNKGLRTYTLINNTVRAFGGSTMDCKEQTDYMIDKFKKLKLDDNWYFVPHSEPGHVWGVAVSSNPNDPYISFDTRANDFAINSRCQSCYGWSLLTWGNDKKEYPQDVLYLREHFPKPKRK